MIELLECRPGIGITQVEVDGSGGRLRAGVPYRNGTRGGKRG